MKKPNMLYISRLSFSFVGVAGFEPTTSSSLMKCDAGLSYTLIDLTIPVIRSDISKALSLLGPKAIEIEYVV